ncbi:PH domain-containing protein [Ornithinibacillus scapharcae]|uniref:PH domain-containing protein n=1 Tax=Ornithinibacillus scapharcae TaxID=1147159 RepID=UPI000225B5A9|nr:PH domain-containing protein [Ornithinibacillus scapharcae]
MILIAILLLWFWFKTAYIVKDGNLRVVFGPFSKVIMISDIQKISKSKNPLAAPALSIDRLKIQYGKYDVLLISPKNEREFIIQLIQENAQIQLDETLRSS